MSRYVLSFKFINGSEIEAGYESLDLLISDLECVDAQEDILQKKVVDRETGWIQVREGGRPLAPIVFHMMEMRRVL